MSTPVGYQILLSLSMQLFGLGLAGLSYRYIIEPPQMVSLGRQTSSKPILNQLRLDLAFYTGKRSPLSDTAQWCKPHCRRLEDLAISVLPVRLHWKLLLVLIPWLYFYWSQYFCLHLLGSS